MKHLFNLCAVACPVGAAAGTAGAVQASTEILQIVYLILAIIGAIGSIAVVWMAVYTKIKAKIDKAKEDGQITADELDEIVSAANDAVQDAVGQSESIIDSIHNKDADK